LDGNRMQSPTLLEGPTSSVVTCNGPTDPVHIHPSLTRRSSDLRDEPGLDGQGPQHAVHVAATAVDEHRRPRRPADLLGQRRDEADRKSTRLNSSHQLRSYAVIYSNNTRPSAQSQARRVAVLHSA